MKQQEENPSTEPAALLPVVIAMISCPELPMFLQALNAVFWSLMPLCAEL